MILRQLKVYIILKHAWCLEWMMVLGFSTIWTVTQSCRSTSPGVAHTATLSHLLSSFGWKMSVCCCFCRLQLEHIDEKISFFVKGASHKRAPLLMKDSRSDCLAVRQIKLKRHNREWVDQHETLLFTWGEESVFIKTQKARSEEQMTFN